MGGALLALAITAAGLTAPTAASAAVQRPSVSSEVLSTVAAKGSATFWVYLRSQADLASAAKIADSNVQGATVYQRLTSIAKESQSGVIALLDAHKAKYRSYWISNALNVTGDRELLDALSVRADVAKIEPTSTFKVIEPVKKRSADKSTQATEWGLNSIKAPQVWSDYGIDGNGITVANVDTGVDYTHPALKNKYRGLQADGSYDHNYNWFDPANICSGDAPCDNNSHGTHTMGTMVGSDGGANQIGVAPGAKFIAAKGCETNGCSEASLLASAQWILAPTDSNGQNPRPDLRPDVVNNSWGGGRGSTWYQDAVKAWVAAGIFPAFSNGNSGPGCGSASDPGDYPESYSAGAYDSAGDIADFSSRGSSAFDNAVKPDIAAPGVDVRSSVPGGGYDEYSGTSMASPHVAGSVALLWSAAPSLERDIATTRTLFDDTASDTPDSQCGGTDDDNNVFGEGKLDVFKAVTEAPRGPIARANGTVTDEATGRPITGVTVTSEGRTVLTDAQGRYSLTLEAGTHEVTATKYGYVAETVTVTVEEGQLLVLNFALAPAQMVKVSGKVVDGSGHGWPLYAKVEVTGRPGAPTYTDPLTGTYSVDLPANTTYTVKATPVYPGYLPATGEVVVGTTPATGDLVAKVTPECTATGYRATYGEPSISEDFTAASAPEGWEVVNRTDSGGWGFTDEGRRGNLTGGSGNFAIVDSDHLGSGNTQDTDLITKPLDLSGTASPFLRFNSDFWSIGSGNPIDIDVSADGGASWTNVLHTTDSRRGPRVEEISLAPVAGDADAQVRFRYKGSWAWWWQIDNVQVVNRACTPIPGGLVVGNTTDSNTGAALNGVTVTSDDVPADKAVSAVTPDDANLADGFYWLFSTATGSHGFTAAKSPYTPAKKTVDVPANGVAKADFALGAGRLTVTPPAIESHQVYGSARSANVTVKNTGNAPATIQPTETSKGFEVLKSAEAAGVVTVPVKGLSVANTGRTYATAPKSSAKAADAWAAIPNVPSAIMDNAAITAGGKVYSIGGGTSSGNETKLFVYDPAESTWSTLAAMPHGRAKPSVAEYSGKLYVFGGWSDGGDPATSVDVYDIAAGTWSTLDATNPNARAAAGSAVLDGKVYLVGGCVDGGCAPSTETVVFDLASGTFGAAAAYPHPVSWTGCGAVGGQVVCAGGADGETGVFYADTQVFDGSGWTAGPNLPQNNFGAAATAAGGVLVYAGGAVNNGASLTNATLAYDPASGSWANLPAMAAPKYRAAASCGAYRLGGSSGGFTGTADAAFLDGLADCEGGGDITWLTTDADEGFTLAPGATRKIKVTFTATAEAGVLQPGTFTGLLGFRSDSPYAVPAIDVEMNVSPPASWGKVVGTVTGATCSGGSVPLKATIRLNGAAGHTLVADAQGKYGWWLQRGNYQVVVAKDGYIPEVFTVKVNAGFVETANFELDPVVACSTRAALERRLAV